MKQKLLTLLLAIFVSNYILLADDSGTCGDNLQWYYNSTTHELTITGSGNMWGADPFQNIYLWSPFDKEITSLNLSEGLTNISNCAFFGCTGITSVTIPNSVTSIGDGAFYGCTSLTSVTIPNSVTSIGSNAFQLCTNLSSIIIPNGVTYIRLNTFRDCSNLVNVTIGNSVTSIGTQAFYGCQSLTNVTLPNTVTSIGAQAFYGCSSINSVIIPNSVTSIGEKAFESCTSLTNVTIGNNVTSIGESAFSGCTGLTYIAWNARLCTDFTLTNAPFYSVKAQINNFEFGEEVEKIPPYLCYGMTNLASVNIPNSVTSIEYNAFYGCSGLTSVTIGNSVTKIGERSFSGCRHLTSVSVPNSVTSIGDYAFYGCSGLTSVIIGNSVTSIGQYAFYGCSGLTSVTIGNSVTSIEQYAFSGGCRKLTSMTIPNSVTSIGEYAFDGCSGLTSITIPNSVTSIGEGAFSNCEGLTDVTISNSVTSIENFVFYFCTSLASIIIPNSVTSIGQYAFYDCTSLLNVTIPSSVTSIGRSAFIGCTSLTSVYMLNETPPTLEPSVFSSTCTIYVPCGTLQAYSQAGGYNNVQYVNSLYNLNFGYSEHSVIAYTQYNSCDPTTRITVTPDYGYIFSQWSDGNTDNPRSVTLTNDTTFTAICIPYKFELSIGTNDGTQGVVSGAGIYDYQANCTISAAPNYGYHFVNWSDGNTDNPRVLTLTRDTVFTAQFAPNRYELHVQTNDNTRGNVSGEGTFDYLTECTIKAVAQYGYHFTQWNDGNTDNPRMLTLTRDTVFTALFSPNRYELQLYVNDETRGFVDGAGTYDYLTECTITATAYYGYHFSSWSDGGYFSSRIIQITQDKTLTAYFKPNKYQIYSNTITSQGSVNGLGRYNYLSQCTLTAVPQYGYHFTQWDDGSMENPRVITLTRDTLFTALFAPNIYELQLQPNEETRGNISGAGAFEYLTECTITATADYGYHFASWSDGNTQNPRVLTLVSDTILTANFIPNTYQISTNTTTQGSVSGLGEYDYLSQCTLTAIPQYGYHFTQWNDGNTDNPREIILTRDTLFTALFAPNSYELQLQVNDETQGEVSGSGTYDYLTECTITATANYGYHFTSWNDGNTQNPRVIQMTQDKTLTAYFTPNKYQISSNTITSQGSISGLGRYDYLSQCTLTAVPQYGYHFTQWDDGSMENPRVITLTRDTVFTAQFAIDKSGTCGDNNALTWEYESDIKTLFITGSGTLNSNFTYGIEAPAELQEVVIDEGVTEIGRAFYNISTLQRIILPNSLTVIGNYAFYGCSISNVVLPSELITIGSSAFRNCTGLTSITLPNNVTSIGSSAFEGCTFMQRITLNENLTSIGGSAFRNCTYLAEVNANMHFPPIIDASVFDGCGDLGEIPCFVHNADMIQYRKTNVWKTFKLMSVDEAVVETSTTSATVTTPFSTGDVASYSLTLYYQGEVFCTLTLNSNGQLVGIDFAHSQHRVAAFATSVNGLNIPITGLQPGTTYTYTLDALDSYGNIIDRHAGEFTTEGTTALENINADGASGVRKVIEDGKIVIVLPDGRKFDASGKKLR